MGSLDAMPIFSILFIILMFFGRGIRWYYRRKSRNEKRSLRGQWREAIKIEGTVRVFILIANGIFLLIAIALYLFPPPWMRWSRLTIPDWTRWLGVSLAMLSLPLQIWAHHSLGRHWSSFLEIQEDHSLVTTGPYRWIRHPMYAQSFVFFAGLALVSADLLIFTGLAISVMFALTRLSREEKMMLEKFGDEYSAYMKRSGRLLPKFRRDID